MRKHIITSTLEKITGIPTIIKEMYHKYSDNIVTCFRFEKNVCESDTDIHTNSQPKEKSVNFLKMNSEQVLAYAENNTHEIIEQYKKKYGNIINLDNFRDYVGGNAGLSSNINHKASVYLRSYYFNDILDTHQRGPNDAVKIIMGGAGSGKSMRATMIGKNNHYVTVLEQVRTRRTLIQKLFNGGYKPTVEFMYRDINESFLIGVLERTIRENKLLGWGHGRIVPIGRFEKFHIQSRKNILELHEEFGPDVVTFYEFSDEEIYTLGTAQKGHTYIGGKKTDLYRLNDKYVRDRIQSEKFDRERAIQSIENAYKQGLITLEQMNDFMG